MRREKFLPLPCPPSWYLSCSSGPGQPLFSLPTENIYLSINVPGKKEYKLKTGKLRAKASGLIDKNRKKLNSFVETFFCLICLLTYLYLPYLPTYLTYLPSLPTYLTYQPTLATYLSYLPTYLPTNLPTLATYLPTYLPTKLPYLP